MARVGKAARNPPRDVMFSHAGKQMRGYGRAFGLQEVMGQAGALIGPLVVAAVLASQGGYRIAFAVLVVPAVLCVILIFTTRILYPKPANMEVKVDHIESRESPSSFGPILPAGR